jgi:hypothetical protein
VVEARLIEVDVHVGCVCDTGNAIVLQPGGQDLP